MPGPTLEYLARRCLRRYLGDTLYQVDEVRRARPWRRSRGPVEGLILMADINLLQAINETLASELSEDESVVLLGEDIGKIGGAFSATEGLFDKFGERRVIDMPLAEGGVVGAAIGMSLYGMRPVPEVQFADFLYPAFDQIISEAAKYRYRSGGQYACPLTLRTPYGAGIRGGIYQSQSPEAYLAHTPGLVVVVPSTPADAAGLLRSAIRSEDPVVFLEPKSIYRSAIGPVPGGDHTVAIGQARTVKKGDHVTVIAYGAMVHVAAKAASLAAEAGIEVDLIDLRTLRPLDADTVVTSVARTGKVVLVTEAPSFCGYAAELTAVLVEQALLHLEAPPVRVTGLETPVPYALENLYLPNAERVRAAIEQVVNF